MFDEPLCGPRPRTLDEYLPVLRLNDARPSSSDRQPEPGAVSRRHPSQHAACGDLIVRHPVPESADTGSFRSDGRGIDLLDEEGVVLIMSDLRRSAMNGPRLPGGAAGSDGRGGRRRGTG